MDRRRRRLLATVGTVGTVAVAGCGNSGSGVASLGTIAVLNRDPRARELTVVLRRSDFMDGDYSSGEGPLRIPGATYEDGTLVGATLVEVGSDWPDDVEGVGLRAGGDRVYAALHLGDVDPDCVHLVFVVEPPEGDPPETTTTAGDSGADPDYDLDVIACDSDVDFLDGGN